MFFLQACQGDKLDGGINLRTTETDGEIHNTYRIPVQADFLIVYSTVKGQCQYNLTIIIFFYIYFIYLISLLV